MIFRIDLRIIIFIIIFLLTRKIETYCIIMFFAAVHELGHILTSLFLNIKVKRVTLFPLGFSMNIDENKYISKSMDFNKKEIIIAFAGPFTNLLFTFFIQFFVKNTDTKNMIVYTNLIIALFNLLPIYPLDGGRMLKSALLIFLNEKKAVKYTYYITNITFFLLSLVFSILLYYLKNIGIVLIFNYLFYILIKQNKVYKIKKIIYNNEKI